MKHHPFQSEKGNALIIVMLLFVVISLSVSVGLVAPTVSTVRSAKDTLESKRSYALAESSIEEVFYRIRTAKQVSSTETLTINGEQATSIVTDVSGGRKQISTASDYNDRTRNINVVIQQGVGASFVYGMQGGQGGITMANGSEVRGSIYSNGPITGSGWIKGSATSANSAALTTNQEHGSGTPANDIVFGNANSTQDIAQSFTLSVTEPINKLQFYIKKTGAPSNLTVRLVTDNNGTPSSTTLASGTLSASTVTTTYGWVDVTFSSNPQLMAGTTYWMVIDGSTSGTRYYTIGGGTGYANGNARIGQFGGTWNNTTPTGLDIFFKVFLGGVTGVIDGVTVGDNGVGNAYAHTVTDATVTGTIYCQTGSGNNKSCDASLPDPVAVAMPISDANILDWKDVASSGGTTAGPVVLDGSTLSIGPRKIDGNLTITNNAIMTIGGTLWVTGNLVVDNNGTISLASSYQEGSGVIVVDGTVTIGNNTNFSGSGSASSYLMILSTSSSTSAITLSNNAGAVLLYAANGTVNVANNAGAASINGYRINLNNNAVISYETGLSNANFVNGPSGSWVSTSWREQ